MVKRSQSSILLAFLLAVSCHVALPHHDITITNHSKDSVYFEIQEYNLGGNNIRNMAFEKVTDLKTNITKDTLMGWILKPGDTIHPGKLDTTWMQFAAEKNGLTILFYKRNIEKLPPEQILTNKDIFRRVDFTTKQLDSLKYVIELNN
jgi:hypothetical protein